MSESLTARIEAGDPEADLELIAALWARYKRLRQKYPEAQEYDTRLSWAERAAGWVALAVGLAIMALLEEHHGKKQLDAMRREIREKGANDLATQNT